jgi:chitinase
MIYIIFGKGSLDPQGFTEKSKIMKFKLLSILFFASLTSLTLDAQKTSSAFKIVGYYPIDQAMKVDTAEVPFDKLTHLILAFVNPDSLGNLNQDFAALTNFTKAAHSHNVKLLYSIGGGSYQGQYHALLKDAKRQELIKNLVAKVTQYDADGIDVDLESGYAFGSEVDPNYGIFIKELARSLKSKNKLITAALPSSPGNVVTHEVLTQFDFINIMSYDHTGPWSPDRAENHASYSDAMDDLNYYLNTLKVPKDKLILGVPFYGHGFGPGLNDPVIAWMIYKDIVSTYPGAEWVDHWHLPNGYIMYYNGIPTIKNKTQLAMKKAAGIMIWEIMYDMPAGKNSLLNAINEAASAKAY